MDQAIVQRLRNYLAAVVAPQKGAKEFCIALDLCRIEPEYVSQKKVPCRVLAQRLRLEELLGGRHGIEITAIQLGKHMGAREGNSSARLNESNRRSRFAC